MTEIRLREQGLEWRRVEDEIVVLDVPTSVYFAINDSGTVLWEALAEAPRTTDELVAVLLEEFEVEPDDAAVDVELFVSRLRKQGFLIEP